MLQDVDHFRRQLLSKQEQLAADISRMENEARESRSAEVEDPIDQVTSDEIKATGFQVSTVAAATLKEVREALRRIDEGTYGICLDCDRPIEPARLQAVPWTPYCLADQEKHDRAAAADIASTL